MKRQSMNADRFFRKVVTVFAFAVLAVPCPATAWMSTSSNNDFDSSWNDNDSWSAERMQDDRISAQEEAAREVQRQKRRDELEKEHKKNEAEYLESKAAVRESSRAASRAPRDHFYRKPGYATSSLPDSKVRIEVSGRVYFYDRGIFFIETPGKYVTVTAPAGAVVQELPAGVRGALYKGDSSKYFYYFGTFFAKEDGTFKVVAPPAGALVGYIPDGYSQSEADGKKVFQFGDIQYQAASYQGVIIYQVVRG